jgi:putative redox protein
MKVSVEHLGGMQFQIAARQHRIASDQPAENGGFDEGMTPPELLLASLGACAGFYAAQYLRNQKLATEGTIVQVTAQKAQDPPRLSDFQIDVELPAKLTEEEHRGVQKAIEHCLIKNTLLNPPRIALNIRASVPEVIHS